MAGRLDGAAGDRLGIEPAKHEDVFVDGGAEAVGEAALEGALVPKPAQVIGDGRDEPGG